MKQCGADGRESPSLLCDFHREISKEQYFITSEFQSILKGLEGSKYGELVGAVQVFHNDLSRSLLVGLSSCVPFQSTGQDPAYELFQPYKYEINPVLLVIPFHIQQPHFFGEQSQKFQEYVGCYVSICFQEPPLFRLDIYSLCEDDVVSTSATWSGELSLIAVVETVSKVSSS